MLSIGKRSKTITSARWAAKLSLWCQGDWNPFRHLSGLSARLERHHVFLLAAGIAFNVLLCVLPLFGLVIVVASLFIPPDLVRITITDAVAGALPPTQQVAQLLERLLIELERVRSFALTATIIAIVILLWMASALLSSLRTALNAIFHIPTPRLFVWYKARDLLLTLILVLVIVAMLGITPLVSLLSSNLTSAVPFLAKVHISGWISFGANLISAFGLMYLLYHFVPSQPQPLFIIVRASVVALVLWEVARIVFTAYIEHARSLGAVYGTFSLVVIAALWVYYTALIMLVSAEVAQYWWEQQHAKT
ncbi:MAG: YihY/virulence factor BrkB family protein [Bacteroidota bacterium]|nr:YihY/virulence factor BrkB family protein [Candidatus Kapabacteria bacterium]MCX7936779.1 YihY/virulence factor BrkB family protein [Chlorobiota bacterium]MDW8074177.1 YihY/virulence factor BrkB family protein [Bacteroidota bacterium]